MQIYGNFEGFVLTIALMVKFGCKNTYFFAFVLIYGLLCLVEVCFVGERMLKVLVSQQFRCGKDSYGERSAKRKCEFLQPPYGLEEFRAPGSLFSFSSVK